MVKDNMVHLICAVSAELRIGSPFNEKSSFPCDSGTATEKGMYTTAIHELLRMKETTA